MIDVERIKKPIFLYKEDGGMREVQLKLKRDVFLYQKVESLFGDNQLTDYQRSLLTKEEVNSREINYLLIFKKNKLYKRFIKAFQNEYPSGKKTTQDNHKQELQIQIENELFLDIDFLLFLEEQKILKCLTKNSIPRRIKKRKNENVISYFKKKLGVKDIQEIWNTFKN